jgi:hypothetical protein
MDPLPVNERIAAIKAAILKLSRAERILIRRWVGRWIGQDGSVHTAEKPKERDPAYSGAYPPPMNVFDRERDAQKR